MKTYGQFCPVAKAAEIFAERWTPLIVRELFCGSRRFNELESGLPRISRTLLVQRLRALERAGIVEHHVTASGRVSEYQLTEAGQELASVVVQLGEWGQRWASIELRPTDLDAELLTDFFEGFARGARANVHLKVLYGRSGHHQVEALFKAFGRALRMACSQDRRLSKVMPSTKGLL